MEDPERRVRQLLARHIEFRAQEAAGKPLNIGACHQAASLVRLWRAAGGDWDQPDSFADFDHLMADVELGSWVESVVDDELLTAAWAVAEAARVLS
jgi:hypothetical protein